MIPQHCRLRLPPSRARLQRGVYAVEWAIIFPVFFVLLYAIISYGLSFLVRQSMQFAVEEAARAALQYPSSSIIGSAPKATLAHRKTQAQQTAVAALNWLPSGLRPTMADIEFSACHLYDAHCSGAAALPEQLHCRADSPCLIRVQYRITNYRDNAIALSLPGLGLLLPQSLEASASTLLDKGVI